MSNNDAACSRLALTPGNIVWLQEEHLQYDLKPSPETPLKSPLKDGEEAALVAVRAIAASDGNTPAPATDSPAAAHAASIAKSTQRTTSSAAATVNASFKCRKKKSTSCITQKGGSAAGTSRAVFKCQHVLCDKTSADGTTKFSRCSKCQAAYCSRACQVKDWKKPFNHKAMCKQLAAINNGSLSNLLNQREIVGKWLISTRLYLCPFAVHHYKARGQGFLFVQSPNTLLDLFYAAPVNSRGCMLHRQVYVHYLALTEWHERCSQNFEMSAVTEQLSAAVNNNDLKRDGRVVVVVLLRCGRLCVLTMPLVPDFGISEKLGGANVKEASSDCLQLNLDE